LFTTVVLIEKLLPKFVVTVPVTSPVRDIVLFYDNFVDVLECVDSSADATCEIVTLPLVGNILLTF
jgi:hypothetical protein